MHARVVRFTGVGQETIDRVREDLESGEEQLPEAVSISSMKMLHDPDQGTAVFVAFFDSEGDLRRADEFFDSMDPGDTPGTRASVDRCEVVAEA
jgi:hypothetical protein